MNTCNVCGTTLKEHTPSCPDDDLGKLLISECDAWRVRAEKAESAGAEMREAIQRVRHCIESDHLTKILDHAMSSDSGKGWVSPEEAKEWIKDQCGIRDQQIKELQAQLKLAVEALEKIAIRNNSGATCPALVTIANRALTQLKGQP